MNNNTKMIAYQAIDENVADSTARQIIRYTLECEIFGLDTIQPSNDYLAKKYEWSVRTVQEAIYRAKKSKFITTTGRGRRRCLELNVGFLKGKMAEIQQKKPLKTNLLEDIGRELGIEEPEYLPDNQPEIVPEDLPEKTTTLDQYQSQKVDYNNNNNNNNTGKIKNFSGIPSFSSVGGKEKEKSSAKKKKKAKELKAMLESSGAGWKGINPKKGSPRKIANARRKELGKEPIQPTTNQKVISALEWWRVEDLDPAVQANKTEIEAMKNLLARWGDDWQKKAKMALNIQKKKFYKGPLATKPSQVWKNLAIININLNNK